LSVASSSKNRASARQRAAQLRAEAAQADASRRRRSAITTIGIVVAVIAALVIAKVVAGPTAKSGKARASASATAVQQVTHVPTSVLAAVGAGTAQAGPQPVSSQPVADSNGKPTVLFIGAEWCPFCATERWPLIVALSRFGTFGPLDETASTPADSFPNTATFSLHDVSYTSQYLTFDAKEIQSNQAKNGKYTTLDKLTAAENADFKKANGGFPYINLGGKYRVVTQLDPQTLQGKSVEQIAAALSDPNSDIAKGIDGAANVLTAGLCRLTNNTPANVCTTEPIASLSSQLSG
jgi:thiol-disulfide isomerase/thioredoxin